MIQGSWVALVTPFLDDCSVDFTGLGKLIDWHCANDTAGIVILGTTGEAPTLHQQERGAIIEFTIKHTNNRLPIMVGTGSNSTDLSIEYTKMAYSLGADYALVVAPYYNRPTAAGLYAHYAAIASSCNDMPIMIYNVPSRTAVDIPMSIIPKLGAIQNIIGIKDASGECDRVPIYHNLCPHWVILSGNDPNLCQFMQLGGHGTISVTANLTPKIIAQICSLSNSGKFDAAFVLAQTIAQLNATLFVETNPIAVKYALYRMGKIVNQLRLPLTALSNQYHTSLDQAMLAAKILLPAYDAI